jgi:hypothetical protein
MAGRSLSASAKAEGLMGGGGLPASAPCMTDPEREQTLRAITEWQSHHPDTAQRLALDVPPKFTFYPLGGTLYGDVFTANFVDLDPGPDILDWDCTANTYNGHDASDVLLRSFGEQLIGVPVFAALDGTVVDAHDGEPDMHSACAGIANYVILQHAGGRVTYYLHLKQNSVQVSVSQVVRAGEQLGLAASSGCSDWPHLHFATYDNSSLVEPYAGLCRPGESQWVDQTAMNPALYVRDLNFSTGTPNLPFDAPRTGTFVAGLQSIRFWILTGNLPANSNYRFRFIRPDSSLAFDSGLGEFGNPYHRFSWWWWSQPINVNQLGTWHLNVELNGTPVASAPFDVVVFPFQIVNRPPNPITAQIEPFVPTEDDVLICRVNTDLILDDPDYNIVRYRYVWEVDGSTVRDVVTAGHADVIPHHTASPGSVVTCTVTPGDGTSEGLPAQATKMLAGPIPTLSEWGVMSLAGAMVMAASAVLRKRR